jgi:hypothetical protein
MIVAGTIAAIVIVFAYVSTNSLNQEAATKQDSLDNSIEQSSTSEIQGPSLTSQGNDISGIYRINTESIQSVN